MRLPSCVKSSKMPKAQDGAIVESHKTQEQMVEDVDFVENGQGAEAPECVIPPQEGSPCLVVKIKSKGKRSKKLKKTLHASAHTLDEILLPVMEEDAPNDFMHLLMTGTSRARPSRTHACFSRRHQSW